MLEAYLDGLRHALEHGPQDEVLHELTAACRALRLTPGDVVRLHGDALMRVCAESPVDAAALSSCNEVLEHVVRRIQPDSRQLVHDVRNSVQLVTGWLSLAQRDLERNGGAQVESILLRARNATQELLHRVEEQSPGTR